MNPAKRILLIALVVISCIGCDRITKIIARQTLANSEPISLLSNCVRIQYAENSGAFLSLGAGTSENVRFWLFTVINGIFLAGMLLYLMISSHNSKEETIALSLVAGGGISNLTDRIFNEGRVIDFMYVGIGSLHTGVFNIADMAITFGIAWVIALSFAKSKSDFPRQ